MKKTIMLIFFTLITISNAITNQYIEEYTSKPNGVYIVISSYSCTACLTTLVNDLKIKLEKEEVYYEVDFYARSEFEFSKYKKLFNCEVNFKKIDSSKILTTKYIIKKDNFYLISDLNQHLNTVDILDQTIQTLNVKKLIPIINEVIFSVDNLTVVNETTSFFSDQFNGNVYSYDKKTIEIKLENYKIDSLKAKCLENSRDNLPYVWENGYSDSTDFYKGLTERMNKLQRINSFAVKNGKPLLLFSFITHSKPNLDKVRNIRELIATYTQFSYSFSENKLEESKFEVYNEFYFNNDEYAFLFKDNEWILGKMLNDTLNKKILVLPDYKKIFQLNEDVLILNRDSTVLFNLQSGNLRSFNLKIDRQNQLIPIWNKNSGIYSAVNNEKTIEITRYVFKNEIFETNYILNKSLIGTDNYLDILDIEELDNHFSVTVLTEEQNIYKISFEN